MSANMVAVRLRKGKAKSILLSSIDAALAAVEIYNKPRITFRCENYIMLMVVAWTRLLHVYFHRTIGDKYYYKGKNGRYDRVDGERKAWELKTCIDKYGKLNPAVVANLEFFIGLRNKIEHRHVDRRDVGITIFGECQSLLYNYENTLVELLGEEYAMNESLVYSLQFSHMRIPKQQKAGKLILSKEVEEILDYVKKYRGSLSDSVFNSQEYSIKLIQIPKVSNTNRNDLAIEFVRWNELSEEEKELYRRLPVLIKDKVIVKSVVNAGKLKPKQVCDEVKKRCGMPFNYQDHRHFYYVFSVRPIRGEGRDSSDTNTEYCHYDEAHRDYVYEPAWAHLLARVLLEGKIRIPLIAEDYKAGRKRHISDLE